MNQNFTYPKIDNASATCAERQRYLAVQGCRLLAPQPSGLKRFKLERPGGAIKLLQASEQEAALKEACALV